MFMYTSGTSRFPPHLKKVHKLYERYAYPASKTNLFCDDKMPARKRWVPSVVMRGDPGCPTQG